MTKNTIHVVPHTGRWAVTAENRKTPIKTFDTKAEASAHGKKVAEKRGVDYIIHKSDGTIEDRRTPQHPRHAPIHVAPHQELWEVKEQNGPVISTHTDKYYAVQRGKESAKEREQDVVIHYADGTVQDRFDPRRSFRPTVLYLGT